MYPYMYMGSFVKSLIPKGDNSTSTFMQFLKFIIFIFNLPTALFIPNSNLLCVRTFMSTLMKLNRGYTKEIFLSFETQHYTLYIFHLGESHKT